MNALQASRRGFLSNLAILTAGVTLGSNTPGLFSNSSTTSNNLELLWKSFCRLQGGQRYEGTLENRKEIPVCKGHQHVDGELVYFAGENILAEPTWIHWEKNAGKPSDLIINFYKDSSPLISLNQYELKALLETPAAAGKEAQKLISLLKINEQGQSSFAAQVIVNNDKAEIQYA